MTNLNFSKEELSCMEEVKKVPEAQKQSVFEKACATITNKTRIALLATTLSLTPPALAQNTPQSNPDYQAFYTELKTELPKLSKEQMVFFANLYIEGLKVVKSDKKQDFRDGMLMIAAQTESKSLVMPVVNDMLLKNGVLPSNHPYTKKLIKITTELDKIGQKKIDGLKKQQQQAKEQQQYYKQIQDFWLNMDNKFKDL